MKFKIISRLLSLPFSLAAIAGNSSLSGAHYKLNIIGVAKNKSADPAGSQDSRIVIPLEGKSKIYLSEGQGFSVSDSNGTDGSAKFQLPNPDPEKDGVTAYSVYARALGKPVGSASLNCAIDPQTMEEVCSLQSVVMVRNKGPSSFTNVSTDLLNAYADFNGDGNIERIPLFDDRLQDYLWSYDSRGIKILQLRFYQISSDLNP